MARKIKLPLDMGNDIKVRDIDELKENYNSEKVVEYFLSGELLSWLNDRFYDDEAEKVEALSADKDSGNVAGKLAEIFGVHIEGEVDVDEIAERKERLEKLRKITSDDEVLRNVDLVAFSQEDMDIVHESDVIYLCGEKFRIPYNVRNKRYIGVNDPLVDIKTDEDIDLDSRGIIVEGCRFTEETLSKLPEQVKEPTAVNTQPVADGIFGEIYSYYSPKGAKGDLASFERLDFDDAYIESIGIGYWGKNYKDKPLELQYENKYIYISTSTSIHGQASLKFKNCVIHLGGRENESKSAVYFWNKANVLFSECTFISDECGIYYNTIRGGCGNGQGIYLFSSYADVQVVLSFKDCLFIHSNYLIGKEGFGSDVHIRVLFKDCHFINCYVQVCKLTKYVDVAVNNCVIYQDGRDMSFYNDEFVNYLEEKRINHTLCGYKHSHKNSFIRNLCSLFMFYNFSSFEKNLSMSDNLIMQHKNMEYLKETVGDAWEVYGTILDMYDLEDTEFHPYIFPEGAYEKNTSYADPSDREALDNFFNKDYSKLYVGTCLINGKEVKLSSYKGIEKFIHSSDKGFEESTLSSDKDIEEFIKLHPYAEDAIKEAMEIAKNTDWNGENL